LRRGGARRQLRTLVSNFVHTPSVNERTRRGVMHDSRRYRDSAAECLLAAGEARLLSREASCMSMLDAAKTAHATAATEHSRPYSVPRGNPG
jgi:hypothetical protein